MTKLLIVDDNEQNIYMLQVLLEGHGYEVVSAGDGAEAMEKARRDPPDMIVSDILMPVMDGFTLCCQWKQDKTLQSIPLVFYTATYTDLKDEEFALSLGAERFIVKPVEPDVFVEMLREVIEEHRAGAMAAPRQPVEEEPAIMRQYSQRLVKKLEDKMLQLEQANQRLTALYQTSAGLSSVKPLDELVSQVLRSVVEAMGYANASYFAYDEEQVEFRLLDAVGFSRDVLAALQRELVFSLGEERGLVGLVGQTREALIVADTTRDPRWITLNETIRSALFVPVMHEGLLLGVANFLSTEAGAFDDEDARNVVTLANNLGIAIENARLFEEIQKLKEFNEGIVQNMIEGIIVEDAEGHITFVNPSAAGLLGYSPVEMIGKHWTTITPSDQRAFVQAADEQRALGESSHYELQIMRKDGTQFPVLVSGSPRFEQGRFTGTLAVFTDITELRQRERHLALLNDITRTAVGMLDFQDMLQTLADRMGELLDADGCYITLWDEARQTTLPAAASGPLRETYPSLCPEPGEVTMTTSVLRAGKPLAAEDVFDTPYISPRIAAQFPTRSMLGLPLIVGDQKLGAILIAFDQPHLFTPDEIARGKQAARQIALAVAKAQLLDETQRQLIFLEALHTIDRAISASVDINLTIGVFLDQVLVQLDVDAADVLLFDPFLQTLECIGRKGFRTSALQHTHLRLGRGLAGQVGLQREIKCIPDLQEESEVFLASPDLSEEEFRAYYGIPLVAKGVLKGVLEIFHRAPLSSDNEWLTFLNALAGQAAIAIDNAVMFTDLQRANLELGMAYDSTLVGWAKALELKDMETEGHSRRVVDLTMQLASQTGVSRKELVHIRRGALLHDIGKMGVPDSILNKPGPLNDEEWDIIHQHPVYAYEMLKGIDYLRPALDIPYAHHERWDGTGYPRGLKGEQIPLAARIFAVVDVWDALNSDRPYRDAWPEEKVIEYLREQSGIHFDPQVVKAFMELIPKVG